MQSLDLLQTPSTATLRSGELPGSNEYQLLEGAAAHLDPEAIIKMLKEQLSPEAAMLLELLIEMITRGQNPLAPEGAQANHAPAPAAGHGGPSGADAAASAGPSGAKEAGGDGFLWKPVSESDGNLVVLLPPGLKGKVDSVEIQDANGNILDSGRFAGDRKNGDRPHFRFSKPGGAYGAGLKVVAKTSDGRAKSFDVGNGAERHD